MGGVRRGRVDCLEALQCGEATGKLTRGGGQLGML